MLYVLLWAQTLAEPDSKVLFLAALSLKSVEVLTKAVRSGPLSLMSLQKRFWGQNSAQTKADGKYI